MRYLHKHIKRKKGSSRVLIGIDLSGEDWNGLNKIAPEEEIFPHNYDNMDLDQLLCWVRIMLSYTELWEKRHEAFASKAIQKLIARKELVSRQKGKVSRRRKRVKRKLGKKT